MGRVIHFEIHAAEPARAIAFYQAVFGWRFQQWGDQPYWLVVTGEDGTPGINGGLLPRRGAAPLPGQAVNAFVCTVDVDDLAAALRRVEAAGGAPALARETCERETGFGMCALEQLIAHSSSSRCDE